MRRKIKIITIAAVVLIGPAAALAVFYSPGYFAGLALDLILGPGEGVEIQLPGEPEQPGVQQGEGQHPGDPSPGGAAAPERGASPAEPLAVALAEQKDKLEPDRYSRYNRILSKYHAEFSAQQAEFEQELNGLLGSALQEYRQGGKNRSELLKMADRYLAAGKGLEASSDSRFYASLAAMEAALKAESLPTGVVEQAQSSYQNLKSARRQQLINKARAALR